MSTALFFFFTLDFNLLILECNSRPGVINIWATGSFRTSKILSNAKGCQFDNTLLKQRYIKCCCFWLPDPFRGMGAWRKTMEPQKPGFQGDPKKSWSRIETEAGAE